MTRDDTCKHMDTFRAAEAFLCFRSATTGRQELYHIKNCHFEGLVNITFRQFQEISLQDLTSNKSLKYFGYVTRPMCLDTNKVLYKVLGSYISMQWEDKSK